MTTRNICSGTTRSNTRAPVGGTDAWSADLTRGVLPGGAIFSRASRAGCWDASGGWATVETDIPRFDFDPLGLRCRGLLVEESRTNQARATEAIGDAWWTRWEALVESDAVVSPSGADNGDRLYEDGSDGEHFLLGGMTLPAGGSVAVSAFYKASGRSLGQVLLRNDDWSAYVAGGMDVGGVSEGNWEEASGSGVLLQGLQQYGVQTWMRGGVAGTLDGSSTAAYAQISLLDGGGGYSYGGDGASGMGVWGVQFEAGPFASSYISNGSSTGSATRAADVASLAAALMRYNPGAGTLVMEWEVAALYAGRPCRVGTLHDGSVDNEIALEINGSGQVSALIRQAGSTVASLSASGNVQTGTVHKTALAWQAGYACAAHGGTLLGEAGGFALPGGISTLRLGDDHAAAKSLNGHIRRIFYFPQCLGKGQIQQLTV